VRQKGVTGKIDRSEATQAITRPSFGQWSAPRIGARWRFPLACSRKGGKNGPISAHFRNLGRSGMAPAMVYFIATEVVHITEIASAENTFLSEHRQ
jgi:hypothetical protein